MSKRTPILLIQDMLEAIAKVRRYTEGLTAETFSTDEKSVDAVVRNLEIIGEAANRLPNDFKLHHIEVAWPKIVGLRNRIVHDYFGLDLQMVWQILQRDLPALNSALVDIVRLPPPSSI